MTEEAAQTKPASAAETAPKTVLERLAGPEDEGARLDRWMARIWPELSRSRCKALVEDGRLSVDGAVLRDPSASVRAGAAYALAIPAPTPATPKPEAIPLNVLYEDDHLIVVDKPPGMAVHPAVGHWTGTLVHALLHHCAGSLSGVGGVERPGIVHRLDKDTSGVLVAAKTDAAHRGLSELFATHDIERVYLAAVRGAPRPRSGTVQTKLARSTKDRKKQAVLPLDAAAGKRAVTAYETVKTFGQEPGQAAGTPQAALVRCRLHTGRTHQIRVHLAHLGAPVLGDQVYGKGGRALRRAEAAADDDNDGGGRVLKEFRRQALHAAVLGFVHPVTGEDLRFETEPPKDMQRLIKFLELL